MSTAELPRFEELVSRYLDDALADREAAELVALLAEPTLAARFLEMTRLNSEITGLLAAPVPDAAMVELVRADIENAVRGAPLDNGVRLRIAKPTEPPASSPSRVPPVRPLPRPRMPVFRALAWAAVFLVIAGLTAVYLVNRVRAVGVPSVASLQGQVRVKGPAGERVMMPGQSWQRGQTLTTVGPKSTATLTFSDSSQLVFGGNSVAVNRSSKEERRIVLDHGVVQGTVKKQPARRAFVFVTAQAEAIVVGTTLQVATDAHQTRLEVTVGEVRFRRRHDGAEIAVRAGYFAVAALNLPLVAEPLPAEPQHVQ